MSDTSVQLVKAHSSPDLATPHQVVVPQEGNMDGIVVKDESNEASHPIDAQTQSNAVVLEEVANEDDKHLIVKEVKKQEASAPGFFGKVGYYATFGFYNPFSSQKVEQVTIVNEVDSAPIVKDPVKAFVNYFNGMVPASHFVQLDANDAYQVFEAFKNHQLVVPNKGIIDDKAILALAKDVKQTPLGIDALSSLLILLAEYHLTGNHALPVINDVTQSIMITKEHATENKKSQALAGEYLDLLKSTKNYFILNKFTQVLRVFRHTLSDFDSRKEQLSLAIRFFKEKLDSPALDKAPLYAPAFEEDLGLARMYSQEQNVDVSSPVVTNIALEQYATEEIVEEEDDEVQELTHKQREQVKSLSFTKLLGLLFA